MTHNDPAAITDRAAAAIAAAVLKHTGVVGLAGQDEQVTHAIARDVLDELLVDVCTQSTDGVDGAVSLIWPEALATPGARTGRTVLLTTELLEVLITRLNELNTVRRERTRWREQATERRKAYQRLLQEHAHCNVTPGPHNTTEEHQP